MIIARPADAELEVFEVVRERALRREAGGGISAAHPLFAKLKADKTAAFGRGRA